MKDDDEGGDEGSGEGSDEGVMKVILSQLRGFASRLTDERTDIGECRVAFATENLILYLTFFMKVNIYTRFSKQIIQTINLKS